MRAGQLATAEGVSYLEAKHLLLLHYCIHLVFYFLLKAEGRPVADHPVIGRLVEIRAFLDKARPIDKRLRYQMDKLLAAAAAVLVLPRSSSSSTSSTTRSSATPQPFACSEAHADAPLESSCRKAVSQHQAGAWACQSDWCFSERWQVASAQKWV